MKWNNIRSAFDNLPKCITHGDFINKNIFIAKTKIDKTVFVIDWETASYSSPIVDLGGLDWTIFDMCGTDLNFYEAEIQKYWQNINTIDIEMCVNIGIVFRYLEWINIYSDGINQNWAKKAFKRLMQCEHSLSKVSPMV